jgi:hypothetical protein
MVNLSQFVDKKVVVTFRDKSREVGFITQRPSECSYFPFTFVNGGNGRVYKSNGAVSCVDHLTDPKDIIKIEEIETVRTYEKAINKEELKDRVTELESQLLKAKQELADFKDFPKIVDANVRDELEDGSIVIYNCSGVAIVIAPKSTECRSKWFHSMPLELRNSLESKGFQPNQWFIPDVKQLNYAMLTVPEQFERCSYWSSDILTSAPTEWVKHRVGFPSAVYFPRDGKAGSGYTLDRSMVLYVRAFRCIFH